MHLQMVFILTLQTPESTLKFTFVAKEVVVHLLKFQKPLFTFDIRTISLEGSVSTNTIARLTVRRTSSDADEYREEFLD